jgi:hypothetical protein
MTACCWDINRRRRFYEEQSPGLFGRAYRQQSEKYGLGYSPHMRFDRLHIGLCRECGLCPYRCAHSPDPRQETAIKPDKDDDRFGHLQQPAGSRHLDRRSPEHASGRIRPLNFEGPKATALNKR